MNSEKLILMEGGSAVVQSDHWWLVAGEGRHLNEGRQNNQIPTFYIRKFIYSLSINILNTTSSPRTLSCQNPHLYDAYSFMRRREIEKRHIKYTDNTLLDRDNVLWEQRESTSRDVWLQSGGECETVEVDLQSKEIINDKSRGTHLWPRSMKRKPILWGKEEWTWMSLHCTGLKMDTHISFAESLTT